MNCFNCQQPIRGTRAWVIDGMAFCLECRPCPHCARLGDCQECPGEAVNTLPQAGPLYAAAQEFLADLGLVVACPSLEVSAAMPAGRRRRYSHQRSLAEVQVDGVFGANRGIWLRSGLRRWRARATLVHELTHAWQAENCPAQSLELQEGLARWAEWQFLIHDGLELAAASLYIQPCPTYGHGLRLCVRWAQVMGVEAMLDAVRTARDFPLWLRCYHGILSFFES